jgi:ribosomal protein S18 acetylase RimI-like enzyme
MEIRPGTPSDLQAIKRIAKASFSRTYAFFAIRAGRSASPLLIAEEDGIATGFLAGHVFDGRPPIGYVFFVAVDPAHRRQNVGRLLVEEALRSFAGRRATRAFAAVPRDNEASMGLFASLEFQRVPRWAMWRWYGLHGLVVLSQMLLAPHEVLLARTLA